MRAAYATFGRRIDPARLPRWLRPKLRPEQRFGLGLANNVNLDAIASGTADATILWQFAGGALTWSRIAHELQRTDPTRYDAPAAAMAEQLLVARALLDRYRITGEVRFEGTEYDAVREATVWADAIAEVVDQPTAAAAADWSERQIELATSGGTI